MVLNPQRDEHFINDENSKSFYVERRACSYKKRISTHTHTTKRFVHSNMNVSFEILCRKANKQQHEQKNGELFLSLQISYFIELINVFLLLFVCVMDATNH